MSENPLDAQLLRQLRSDLAAARQTVEAQRDEIEQARAMLAAARKRADEAESRIAELRDIVLSERKDGNHYLSSRSRERLSDWLESLSTPTPPAATWQSEPPTEPGWCSADAGIESPTPCVYDDPRYTLDDCDVAAKGIQKKDCGHWHPTPLTPPEASDE